jgi:pyruvate kinase
LLPWYFLSNRALVCRGLIPLLAEGSTDSESTDDILNAAIGYALKRKICLVGDSIVALHRIGVASIIKIMEVKEPVNTFSAM